MEPQVLWHPNFPNLPQKKKRKRKKNSSQDIPKGIAISPKVRPELETMKENKSLTFGTSLLPNTRNCLNYHAIYFKLCHKLCTSCGSWFRSIDVSAHSHDQTVGTQTQWWEAPICSHRLILATFSTTTASRFA
jgi:hypothetical protein